jgi:hypothetical protein
MRLSPFQQWRPREGPELQIADPETPDPDTHPGTSRTVDQHRLQSAETIPNPDWPGPTPFLKYGALPGFPPRIPVGGFRPMP